MLRGEVVLLADIPGQIDKLPALVLEFTPIDQRPVALANRLLRAETPAQGVLPAPR
jgi:hypothetical protein